MQKIKRGSGFRGVLNYALDDRGEIIGANMAGLTPRELASEFKQSRTLREDIEKPVWHNSLRLPEGERLTAEKWVAIADDYMERMGFGELHQRAYILHDEPDGQHIHIIASRIDLTGKVYLGQNENLKSTKHIAELENVHGLIQTPQQRDPTKTNRKAVTVGEKGLEIRTEIKPPREQLQDIIDKATRDKPRFTQFVERLHKSGVSVLPSGKTGMPQGISFELGGVPFKGSDLGKSYAWKQLQARIEFSLQLDQQIIDQLRQNPKELPVIENAEHQKENLVIAPIHEATQQPPVLAPPAFVDNNGKLETKLNSQAVAIDLVKIATERGWTAIKINGTDDFKREVWLEAETQGLQTVGYEPTELDKATLAERQKTEDSKVTTAPIGEATTAEPTPELQPEAEVKPEKTEKRQRKPRSRDDDMEL